MKLQNLTMANELDKAGSELISSLRDNSDLGGHMHEMKAVITEERLGRERERAALKAAMNGIDDLSTQVDLLRIKDTEREAALDKIASLERDKEAIRYENFALQEEVMLVRGELAEVDEKISDQNTIIEALEAEKYEYETGDG